MVRLLELLRKIGVQSDKLQVGIDQHGTLRLVDIWFKVYDSEGHWVSIFEPARLAELLGMPEGAEPVAILCLGPVPEFPDRPALEIDDWTHGRPLSEFIAENTWTAGPSDHAPFGDLVGR